MSKKGDVAKGNRVEREFFLKLQAAGFLVWKSGRRVIWIPDHKDKTRIPNFKKGKKLVPITMNNDIHGLFDLHAKHSAYPDYNFWFQIAANAWKTGQDREAIEAWPSGVNDVVCMVRRMDRMPFDIRMWEKEIVKVNGEVIRSEDVWTDLTLDEFFERFINGTIKIKKEA